MAVTQQDREDYPYIVASSLYFGSYAYWTEDQIRMAREYNAPRTTDRVEVNFYTREITLHDIHDATEVWKERIKGVMDAHGLGHSEIDD
jgi:hypothetical protein